MIFSCFLLKKRYFLFEGVCVPKLPSSWPRRARKGGPKQLIARGGKTASATLKRYVFQDSMRPPRRGSSFGHFFAKTELPLERCRTIFTLCDTSREGAPFLARNASRSSPTRFFDLSEKIDFRSGGVVKIATLIFTRVLQKKMALQKCIISRVGDSFLKRKGNSR